MSLNSTYRRGLRTQIALASLTIASAAFVPRGDAAAQTAPPSASVPVESLPKAASKPKSKRPRKPVKKPTKAQPPAEANPVDLPPAVVPSPAPPPVVPGLKPVEPNPVTVTPAPAATAPAPATVATVKDADDKFALHLGARYRLGILPQPFLGLFARGGGTYLFHFAGVELDARWKRFSLTPALAYADLSTAGAAFGERNQSGPGYVSFVQSDLKAVLATVDLAWTFPLSASFEAELGVGLGVGVPFGDLVNDWVHETPNGPLVLDGKHYAACNSVNDGIGCRPQDHASPTPVRVNGYVERGWTNGGSSPTVVPWLAIPQAALRIRLSQTLAMRVGFGLATTGLWVGVGVTRALSSAQHEP